MSFERLPTGRGIRCRACGGSLSAEEAIHDRLTQCPRCGASEELSAELRAELQAHHADVGRGLGRIAGDRQSQAVLEGQLALRPRHYVVLIGPLFVFTAPTLWFSKMGAAAYAISLIGGWVAYFAFLSWVWPRISKPLAAGDTAGTIATSCVRCPTCGGENDLRVDATVARCHFCDGALSPDSETLARVRERMRGAEAEAEQERRRTEWRAAAIRNRDQRTDRIPVVLAGLFVSLMVLAGLTGLVRVILIGGPSENTASPLVLALVAVVPGTFYGLWLRHRRRSVARIDQAIARLVAALGGEVERHPRALAAWLGENWLGPFDPRRVCAGRHYALVWADLGGLPLAISICPFTEKHTLAERHLRILIAAPTERPLMAVRSAAKSTIDRLGESGFSARVFAEGWVIEGASARVDALQSEIDAALELTEVLQAVSVFGLASLPAAS